MTIINVEANNILHAIELAIHRNRHDVIIESDSEHMIKHINGVIVTTTGDARTSSPQLRRNHFTSRAYRGVESNGKQIVVCKSYIIF